MPATVLVVDDDHDIRESLADILREEGFRVQLASNGLEALQSISAEEPDLLLLDLMMPVMSGWELMRALKDAQRRVPTIILSAVPAPGCAGYIEKPISLDRLLLLLDSVRSLSMTRMVAANEVGDDAAESPSTISTVQAAPKARGTIFIVDDDDDTRMSVAAVLEAEGYEIRTASNGLDALKILESQPLPDLMLLDLMMPIMTGWDVLEAVGKIQRLEALSIVVFSAADDTRSTRRITRPLLRKPIDLDLLLEMVERLSDARALGDEPPSDLFPKMI